jgi:hypothetical protein
MRHDSEITRASATSSRANSDGSIDVTSANSVGLAITPYFTTSYKPARNSRRGKVVNTTVSAITSCGG